MSERVMICPVTDEPCFVPGYCGITKEYLEAGRGSADLVPELPKLRDETQAVLGEAFCSEQRIDAVAIDSVSRSTPEGREVALDAMRRMYAERNRFITGPAA